MENIYTYKQWCEKYGRKENLYDNFREFLALIEKEQKEAKNGTATTNEQARP